MPSQILGLAKHPDLRNIAGKVLKKQADKAERWWEIEGREMYKGKRIPLWEFKDEIEDDEGEGGQFPWPVVGDKDDEDQELRDFLEKQRQGGEDYQTAPATPFKGGFFRPIGWDDVPRYYPFDRDTGEDIVPLRPESEEMVSRNDINKKLWKCAAKGQTKLALACIRAGADVNALDYTAPYNHTAVSWACWGGNVETLRMLVEHGGDLTVKDRLNQGLMHIAAANGHTEVCEELFRMTDGNIYDRDHLDRLPIHAATLSCYTRTVERLAELGSNVNAVDFRMETPLHLAAHKGHLPTAKILVELGADPRRENCEKRWPIDVAEQGYHKKVYYFLESLVGEKCVFDRDEMCDAACGMRHADRQTEMWHRRGPHDMLNYSGPEKTPWAWEEEFLRTKPAKSMNKAEKIYSDPGTWEQAIKTEVDLFPNEEGDFKMPGEEGYRPGSTGSAGQREGEEGGGEEESSTSIGEECPAVGDAARDERLRRQHRRYVRLEREKLAESRGVGQGGGGGDARRGVLDRNGDGGGRGRADDGGGGGGHAGSRRVDVRWRKDGEAIITGVEGLDGQRGEQGRIGEEGGGRTVEGKGQKDRDGFMSLKELQDMI